MGHLNKGTSGHLLKSVNGHLVNACAVGRCDCGYLSWYAPLIIPSKTLDYIQEGGLDVNPCAYYYVGYTNPPTATDISGTPLKWWLSVYSRPIMVMGPCLFVSIRPANITVSGITVLGDITTTLLYHPSVVPDPVLGFSGNRAVWQLYTQATYDNGLTLFLLSGHGLKHYADEGSCVDPETITDWDILYNNIKTYADSVSSINTAYTTSPDAYGYAEARVVNPAGNLPTINPIYSAKDPIIYSDPCT
jgi:hypothetical protein